MSFLRQEFRPLRLNRKYLGILLLLVSSLRLISTLLYFKKNGLRSSYGGDIWFFMGVAQGHEHLFWSDPLQYLLPLIGKLSPETIFDILLVASNIFHLLSITLLFLFCLELTQHVSASFWAALFYSLTMTSFNFSTASFHHQQAALPVLILCLWIIWRIYSHGFTLRRSVGLLFLSLVCLAMGPDVFVILLTLIPLILIKLQKHKKAPLRGNGWVFPLLLLGIWIGLIFLLFPFGESLFKAAAAKARGIDLSAQKLLQAEDLLPFGLRGLWTAYSWIAIVWIALCWYSWVCGRFFEGFIVLTSFLFADFAARFYFLTEIGFTLIVAWFLSRQSRPKVWGSVFTSMLVLSVSMRGVACLYPGILWHTLEPLRKEPDKKLVLCTPTYGFLVRSLTGHKPTSDWHHLHGHWIHAASQKAEPAWMELKRLGANYAFFTSVDLQVVEVDSEGGKILILNESGGFQLPSTIEDVQETFAYRLLYGTPFEGATILRKESTWNGIGKAVLARLN